MEARSGEVFDERKDKEHSRAGRVHNQSKDV